MTVESVGTAVLRIDDLTVRYGEVPALRGVSMRVDAGEVVAVVGPNGAGKTTLLRSISGMVRRRQGSVMLGERQLMGMRPYQVARAGFAHVPEGRGTIATLTVEENLLAGGPQGRSTRDNRTKMEELFTVFPLLAGLRARGAGLLSGGEQQLLAIARGLMAEPVVLAIDEPSMGLAPVVTQHVLTMLRTAVGTGVSILLVEQNAALAAQLADRIYVLVRGEVRAEGTAGTMAVDDLLTTYLG